MNDLEKVLAENPGDPAFVEQAGALFEQGKELEAIEVCLAGLSASPELHRGRLLLAKILFSKSFIPFALRELRYLNKALPENEPIRKLLEKLSLSSSDTESVESSVAESAVIQGETSDEGGAEGSEPEEVTVAESDFDLDELDLIMEEES